MDDPDRCVHLGDRSWLLDVSMQSDVLIPRVSGYRIASGPPVADGGFHVG
jgi:hypothetical protein